jgi:CheY-like chemotaxis protein
VNTDTVSRGLIVDDQRDFAEIVEELMTERLEKFGWRFEFEICTSATDATKILETYERGTFDLVLTDMFFPAPDRPQAELVDQNPLGEEVIEAAVKAEVKVIVGFSQLQTAGLQEIRRRALDLGANLFVGRNDFTAKTASSVAPDIAALLADREPGADPEPRVSGAEQEGRRQVAVVHGANPDARTAIFEFLEALDLIPVDFREAIGWTGEGSPPNAATLADLIARPQAIVVLSTPDEDVSLHPRLADLRGKGPDRGRQPRPNVYVELGMALAVKSERTILVELGAVRVPSDLEARATVRLDDSDEKREELIERLENAGCAVRQKRGRPALTAGAFEAAVAPSAD